MMTAKFLNTVRLVITSRYLRLWIATLLPSGSLITASRHAGLAIGSRQNVVPAARRALIATSKSATSSATLGPSDDGFHLSGAIFVIAIVPGPTSYSIQAGPPSASQTADGVNP